MTEIRYWGGLNHSSLQETGQTSKRESSPSDRTSFQSLLMDQLLAARGNPSPYFGNNAGVNLMDMDIEGIEKVWAEQLKSPGFLFQNSTNNNSLNNNPLQNIAELTMRSQLIRAQSQMDMALTPFSIGAETSGAGGSSSEPESLEEFINDVLKDVDTAAEKFQMSRETLLNRIIKSGIT